MFNPLAFFSPRHRLAWHASCDTSAEDTSQAIEAKPEEARDMLESYNSTPSYHDIVVENLGVGEHDIPEPLEHWSEQDFDDLVPPWGN